MAFSLPLGCIFMFYLKNSNLLIVGSIHMILQFSGLLFLIGHEATEKIGNGKYFDTSWVLVLCIDTSKFLAILRLK